MSRPMTQISYDHGVSDKKLIVDPEGKAVARGEIGEFCTRGYSVMKGY